MPLFHLCYRKKYIRIKTTTVIMHFNGEKYPISNLKDAYLAVQSKGRPRHGLKSLITTAFRSVKGLFFPKTPAESIRRPRVRDIEITTTVTETVTTMIITRARSFTTTHTTTITDCSTTISTSNQLSIKPAIIITTTTDSIIPSVKTKKFSKTTKTKTTTTTTIMSNINPKPKSSTTVKKTKTRITSRHAFLGSMINLLNPESL